MEPFNATTQYGDMTGIAAADRHDTRAMLKYLQEKDLINENEMIVGISLWSGEIHQQAQERPVSITIYVKKCSNFEVMQKAIDDGENLKFREISLKMGLYDFFDLFKRFEISISTKGILTNQNIITEE